MPFMRTYVADLPGGTATTSVQVTQSQTLRKLTLSWINAAAGKIELSTSAASQIGTAQPTDSVVARVSVGAAGQSAVQLDINLAVKPFQTLYIHQTGAGNLGTAVIA